MCFDLDSHPPIAPIAGAAIDGERISLKASDGARLMAFHARAEPANGAGVLILPDVRGLHPFYEELALRFAERGVHAVAIDYFGRTAGADDRGEAFEYMPHADHIRFETVMLDTKAARDRLVESGIRAVFTLGFCFGGRLAFASASRPELHLSGAIGFYGSTTGPGRGGTPEPTATANQVVCPVLGLFGAADQGIPPSSIEAYGAALTEAGIDHDLISYDGAPHSFFDRKAAEFSDASTHAWQRVLEFIARHTPKG